MTISAEYCDVTWPTLTITKPITRKERCRKTSRKICRRSSSRTSTCSRRRCAIWPRSWHPWSPSLPTPARTRQAGRTAAPRRPRQEAGRMASAMIGSNLYSFTTIYCALDRTARHGNLMSEHQGNVVTFPARAWTDGPPSSRPEVLLSAVGHLDELSRRLEQLSPHATWTARRWMIASTPFRMRLVAVRSRLAELMLYRPATGPDDSYWILEL